MFNINDIKDLSGEDFDKFQGFTACILYTTAHEDFRKFITESWDALNESSSHYALIAVADLPADITQHPNEKSSRPGHVIDFIVSFPNFTPGSTNRIAERVRKFLNINRTDMPCIVFFNRFDEPNTLMYSFNKSDDILNDIFGIFDDCEKAWTAPNINDISDLADYRSRRMINLESKLNKRKAIRLAGKVANNAPFGKALGMLAKGL